MIRSFLAGNCDKPVSADHWHERGIEFRKDVVGDIQRAILRVCIRVHSTVYLRVQQMSCLQWCVWRFFLRRLRVASCPTIVLGFMHERFCTSPRTVTVWSRFLTKMWARVPFPVFPGGFAREELDVGGET